MIGFFLDNFFANIIKIIKLFKLFFIINNKEAYLIFSSEIRLIRDFHFKGDFSENLLKMKLNFIFLKCFFHLFCLNFL